jgi:hypothetical protein
MDVKMSKREAAIWFWSVAGFFSAIWVLLPTLLHSAYRGDVIELQSIAPQWVWATTKHPMLPAWILETLNILTNRSFAAPFIAAQLCTMLALWSVWKLGRDVLDERLALVGSFSVLPYLFFTSKPIWYNQNNVLIAFWCLSIYLVFQAFQTNRKRYWISAGVAIGLAFQAKYSAVFLVISILAYMFMRREGRKYFRTSGPYLTTAIAFLIFLPHVIWLAYHNFAPLTYATDSGYDMPQWFAPLYFAGSQMVYWIPSLVILIPVIGLVWKLQHHEQGNVKECEKFLFYCFMIPMFLHMLYCGVNGVILRQAYGAPFWVFGGLWLLLRFRTTQDVVRCFRQSVTLAVTTMLLIATGFVVLFYLGEQDPDLYYSMRDLGTTCDDIWDSQGYPNNCPYVAGDSAQLIGHVAHAMRVRPSVILPQGTWASDDDLNRKGGMLVWEIKDDNTELPVWLRKRFPQAEQPPEIRELPFNVGSKVHELKIGVAIVPPPSGK